MKQVKIASVSAVSQRTSAEQKEAEEGLIKVTNKSRDGPKFHPVLPKTHPKNIATQSTSEAAPTSTQKANLNTAVGNKPWKPTAIPNCLKSLGKQKCEKRAGRSV